VYWLAIRVVGPSTETIKIELSDSGSFSSWTTFTNTNWGYFVFGGGQVTLPASLRLTNVNSKVVTITNILTAVVPGANIASSVSYDGSSTPSYTPTYAPATPAPATYAPVTPAPATYAPATPAPTSKPNAPATAGPVSPSTTTKVQVHAGASQWWFAVAILDIGSKTVASVQVLDSTQGSTYANLAPSDWGYWVYTSTGKPLVAPLSIRITSTVGTTLVVDNVPVTAGVVSGSSLL